MDQGVGLEVKRFREQRDWSQAKLAVEAEMSVSGVSMIENGQRNLTTTTLAKLANAFGISIADLFPKVRSSSRELSFDDVLGDERRAVWEAAVDKGQRLRDTGRAQMWKGLSEWRASKKRGEPYATRRKYLDEMGDLLQEVYDADVSLGEAYIEAALTQGGSDASGPSFLRKESRAMSHFYGELFGLVNSAGLGIRTGNDAAAAKNAAKADSETRPSGVEEGSAA
jgi:transcriptional regulator with XRE-family HTH domain